MSERIILEQFAAYMLKHGYKETSEIPEDEFEKLRKRCLDKVREWIKE